MAVWLTELMTVTVLVNLDIGRDRSRGGGQGG